MRSILAAAVLLLALAAWPARTETGPKEKDAFLTLPDGAKIHYLEAGQGSPVVLIPGWTIPVEIWEAQIAGLSKSHRVVAYDPRSQGKSSKTGEGSHPLAHAADLSSILDQLHLAPAALVCWSMAANDCLAYVDRYGTARISALVLVDGLPTDPSDAKLVTGLLGYVAQMQRDRPKMTDSFVRSMFKKPRSEEYLKRVIEGALQTPTDTAMALFVGSLGWDPSQVYSKIDKPTLLAVSASPFLPAYQKMHAAIPGSRLEVFQAGHALFVDEPERFNQLVEGFLKNERGDGPSVRPSP